MKHYFIFDSIVLLTLSVFLVGCSGEIGKPPGSPDIFPCKVTVVNGGAPIQNATVIFSYAEHPTAATSASTDEKGVAEMRSVFESYVGPGAPKGICKVAVIKQPSVPDIATPEEKDKMSANDARAYESKMAKALAAAPREVPQSLSDTAKSGIQFDIQEGKNEFTIDISEYK